MTPRVLPAQCTISIRNRTHEYIASYRTAARPAVDRADLPHVRHQQDFWFVGTVGYIASKGLPLPQLLAGGFFLVELVGGLLLIIGWNTRWAAAALFVFTLLAALFFHNFWSMPAEQAQNQMIHFMKNLAMAGGLLYVVVHGSGPFGLDAGRGGHGGERRA